MARASLEFAAVLTLFLLGPILVTGCVGPSEWPVPSWLPGDHIVKRGGVEPGNRTGERWLVGPTPSLDLRGETVDAHGWANEPDGAPAERVDLERGQLIQRRHDTGSGRERSLRLLLELDNGEQWGLGLQGLTLRRGLEFDVPDVWSGKSAHYRVVHLSSSRAVVECTVTSEEYLPLWPTTRWHFHEDERWVLEYRQISPYPTEVRVYHRSNVSEGEERLSNVIRFEEVDLAEGKRRTDRLPPAAGLAPLPGVRLEDWLADLDATGSTDPRFPLGRFASTARSDATLASWIRGHPSAAIVDLTRLRLDDTESDATAEVWNATWRDRAGSAAYSFVRATYPDRPAPVVPLLDAPPPEDRFASWKTGAFELKGPWFEAAERLPQLVPDDALKVYDALVRAAPDPSVVRWTALPLAVVMSKVAPAYVASQGMWDLRWGEATFRFHPSDSTRVTAVSIPNESTWLMGATGESLETIYPYAG